MHRPTDPNVTSKGSYRGWNLYRYAGVPGLALPSPAYWWAERDGYRFAGDTRRELVRVIDVRESMTDADRERAAAIAADLGRSIAARAAEVNR